MEFHSFLGTKTALTAAGVLPLASVFGAVASSDYLLGRDIPQQSGPSSLQRLPVASRDAGHSSPASWCGCEA
jgi:hypothetical protein